MDHAAEALRMREALKKLNNSSNTEKLKYYEGRNRFKNLRVGTPSRFEGVPLSIGWANVIVESLCTRINLDALESDDEWVTLFFRDSQFSKVFKTAVRSASIFGAAYILAQPGNKNLGEPEVLLTAESPLTTYGEVDRLGRVQKLILLDEISKFQARIQLIMPDTTITYMVTKGVAVEESRDDHNLGFVPARRLVNRPSPERASGQSEIDFSTRSLIDEAVRALHGASTAREFYAAPQRYALNIDLNMFKDADGRPVESWDAYMGKMLLSGQQDKSKGSPVIGQFNASSPKPFFESIDALAKQVSAAKSIPVSDLGVSTSTPPSSESMEQQYSGLVKRAEDRIEIYKEDVRALTFLASSMVGHKIESQVIPLFRNPRITALGSLVQADGVTKLIASGVFHPQSTQVYSFLGLSSEEIEKTRQESSSISPVNIEEIASKIEEIPGLEKILESSEEEKEGENG